jgi:hypothetical protein
LDKDTQVGASLGLANKVIQRLGPQGAVKVLRLLLRAKGALRVHLLRGQQFQGGAD